MFMMGKAPLETLTILGPALQIRTNGSEVILAGMVSDTEGLPRRASRVTGSIWLAVSFTPPASGKAQEQPKSAKDLFQ